MNVRHQGADLATAFGYHPGRTSDSIPAYVDEGEPNPDIHVESLTAAAHRASSKNQQRRTPSVDTRTTSSRRKVLLVDAPRGSRVASEDLNEGDSDDDSDSDDDIVLIRRKRAVQQARVRKSLQGSRNHPKKSKSKLVIADADDSDDDDDDANTANANLAVAANASRIRKLEKKINALEKAIWISALAGLLAFAIMMLARSQARSQIEQLMGIYYPGRRSLAASSSLQSSLQPPAQTQPVPQPGHDVYNDPYFAATPLQRPYPTPFQ